MNPSSQPPLDTTRFIARHVAGLRRSGIRDFFELVAKTDGVISLGIGEPDFDTPQPIRDAVKTAMDTGKTHYTSNLGLPELRREICRYVEVPLGASEVTTFSDGEIYVEIGENVRGVNCFVVQSTSMPVNQNLMELLIMTDALKRASAASITADTQA